MLITYGFISKLEQSNDHRCFWDKSCSKMSRNDRTTPLSAIIKTIQWLPCVIWPDMLKTHTTEFIYFTFYAHVLYAMLVLSSCQRLLTNSMKLYSIEIYMYAFEIYIKYNPMKYGMLYPFLHCESLVTYQCILSQ